MSCLPVSWAEQGGAYEPEMVLIYPSRNMIAGRFSTVLEPLFSLGGFFLIQPSSMYIFRCSLDVASGIGILLTDCAVDVCWNMFQISVMRLFMDSEVKKVGMRRMRKRYKYEPVAGQSRYRSNPAIQGISNKYRIQSEAQLLAQSPTTLLLKKIN